MRSNLFCRFLSVVLLFSLLLPAGETVELPLGAPASDGVRRLDLIQRVRVPDGRDSWIAAQVTGDRSLYPVVVPFEIPPLLLNDAVNAVGGAIGLKDEFGNLKPTQIARVTPLAVSNPLLVDGNFDGKWGIARKAAKSPAASIDDARPIDLRQMFESWGD